jgi:Ser/Thr protein kinase RdoA (MazF antagonist)
MNPIHQAKICLDFELGTPISIEENHEGVLNKNYVLTTDMGTYFIKSVREKRKLEIPYIAGVEEYMRAQGIPAVCMLKNAHGDTYVQYDSDVYTVYPFLQSDRSHSYGLNDFKTMGVMLGKIHEAGSSNVPTPLKSRIFKEKEDVMITGKLHEYRDLITSKESLDETDQLFLTYIDTKLNLIPRLAPILLENDVLAHGDYHARNLLISGSREIIGVCDWEKAEMSPRAYELARSIQYVCFEDDEQDDIKSLEYAKAFLEGYISVLPITKQDIENGFALRFRKMVFSFWIESQYYTNYDSRSNKFIPHVIRLINDPLSDRIIGLL